MIFKHKQMGKTVTTYEGFGRHSPYDAFVAVAYIEDSYEVWCLEQESEGKVSAKSITELKRYYREVHGSDPRIEIYERNLNVSSKQIRNRRSTVATNRTKEKQRNTRS